VPIQRLNILGVPVSAIDMRRAVEIVEGWIEKRQTHYVCVTGVHGVMESQRDERLLRAHAGAGLVTPDGMPLLWLGRLRGFKQMDRVYGPDLMLRLCERSLARGYRHYFYGGAEGVPERLSARLCERFPGIHIVGTYSPPFRPLTSEEDDDVARRINAARPDIVWVGLGTPKQERWMEAHRDQLEAAALIGVGAAFDFHAGLKRQAPRWMQRSGLEWLFRLANEPRRLWRRYLVNNTWFVTLVLAEACGLKKYSETASV
jgi:N-acetylglucosaminyldiphosphoundecaprenol N-acetyl-beta-D-mannosaminyltransferase